LICINTRFDDCCIVLTIKLCNQIKHQGDNSMKTLLVAVALIMSASFTTVSADDWFLRFGAANVSPNDDSGPVLGNDGVAVGDDTQFAFSITYMLDNEWGIEVLGATPFKHDITGTGALAGLPIGDTKHLPPTITATYNIKSDGGTLYHVGAGINYTKFFEDYGSSEVAAALGGYVDLDLDASTGLAVKAGFDTPIADNWYFSGSLYYMMIDTTADVFLRGNLATSVDVDIDPWVIMLGFSTKF
jgi:outer membrane protein